MKGVYGIHIISAEVGAERQSLRWKSTARLRKSAISGRVLDHRGLPVEGAVALLFAPEAEGCESLVSRSETDADGFFTFYPVEDGVAYTLRVFRDDVQLREMILAPGGHC